MAEGTVTEVGLEGNQQERLLMSMMSTTGHAGGSWRGQPPILRDGVAL